MGAALPKVTLRMEGQDIVGVLDTGCTNTIISMAIAERLGVAVSPCEKSVCMLNGTETKDVYSCHAKVLVAGKVLKWPCLVARKLVMGYSLLVGMDLVTKLGGVSVQSGTAVFLGEVSVAAVASVATGSDRQEGPVDTAKGCSCREADELSVDKLVVSDDTAGGRSHIESVEVSVDKLVVSDDDFHAEFSGGRWTIEWKWLSEPPVLLNQKSEYSMVDSERSVFNVEVRKWIEEGWLVAYDPVVHGEATGLVPLLSAKQPNKPVKVRPVLDYRELNQHICSFPGTDVAVCNEKLREWRRLGENVSLLDLRKAYLQLHVKDSLQRFQVVEFEGKKYVMTRMGFGLSVAPKIMSRVLLKVLSLSEDIRKGTDAYIDDIVVNESVVSVLDVKKHLARFGLQTKEPVALDGARVLGLHVQKNESSGVLRWMRDNALPVISDGELTKRQVFSLCGQLVGHYPVARWLRVACSYIKRLCCAGSWDTPVSDFVGQLLAQMMEKVRHYDPVQGEWSVSAGSEGKVWCDASSLAVGVCVEIDGCVVEDAAWLRKEEDAAHINAAELEAVVRGLSLAVKWGLCVVTILTDSASVMAWLSSAIQNVRRPKVGGLGEMLIRRRLALITDLIEEYSMTVSVCKVASAVNKADELTRVPKAWLESVKRNTISAIPGVLDSGVPDSGTKGTVRPPYLPQPAGAPWQGPVPAKPPSQGNGEDVSSVKEAVKAVHEQHHLGIDKTMYLAEKKLGVPISKVLVKEVVNQCRPCKQIDPCPIRWRHGSLSVEKVWTRVAADITHVNGVPYLTMIDCGPSRFAIWRRLSGEASVTVIHHFTQVFRERGPPAELLTDNGPCFRSQEMKNFAMAWGITQLFSCAYRPTGNGIIERNHRTVKTMVARTGGKPEEMVYWYNVTQNVTGIIPLDTVMNYETHVQGCAPVRQPSDEVNNPFETGDWVVVKPSKGTCMTPWIDGRVTAVLSDVSVEVNGTPRHIADVRLISRDVNPSGDDVEEASNDVNSGTVYDDVCSNGNFFGIEDQVSSDSLARRQRRPPGWMADYMIF